MIRPLFARRASVLFVVALLLSACGTSPVPSAQAIPSASNTAAPGASTVSQASAAASATPTAIPTSAVATPPPGSASPEPSQPASPAPSAIPSAPPAYDGPWPIARWCPAGQADQAGVAAHDTLTLPILYLHRVEAPPADYATWPAARQKEFISYDTLPQAFAAQLDWLAGHGYRTILPSDPAAHWARGCALPARPVILTFDDGTPDWTSAVLPLLRSHGMVAEFYLTLDAIASHRISWADVRMLAANGMGIGAHDVHHVQLAMLGGTRPAASVETMWAEVSRARAIIGNRFAQVPDSMAYVGGGYDATLMAQVEKAGYATARSIRHGISQRWEDRFALYVVRVGVYDDVIDRTAWAIDPALPLFAAKLSGQAN